MTENADYMAFMRRIVRSAAKRAGADVEALPALIALQHEIDSLMVSAVARCRDDGYSWGEIAQRLGTTRQAAQQRYGAKVTARPNDRQASLDGQE